MSQKQKLCALIEYYQQCLVQERREVLSILEARIEQTVIPLPAESSWQMVYAHPITQQIVQVHRGNKSIMIVYAPYVLTTTRGTRHEPLVGIYGTISRGTLRFDFSDLWISELLGSEMDTDSLQELRDELERGARRSPVHF